MKCAYCHFAIGPRRPGAAREGRYLEALLAEMEAAAAPRVRCGEHGPALDAFAGGLLVAD